MSQVIIFNSADGQLKVCVPNPGCGIPVSEIARKDVPAGLPFKIVDAAEIPADLTYMQAWEADMSSPDGYGIGPDAWFEEQANASN